MNISTLSAHSRTTQGIQYPQKNSPPAVTKRDPQAISVAEFQSLLSGLSDYASDASLTEYTKLGRFQVPSIRSTGTPQGLPEELKSYDSNQDGQLATEEFAAIDADIQSGKLQPPPRPSFGMSGADKAFDPLTTYDLDRSGDLNESELDSLFEDIESGKLQPPPHPPTGAHSGGGTAQSTGKLNNDILKKLLDALKESSENSESQSIASLLEISSTKQLANAGYGMSSTGT